MRLDDGTPFARKSIAMKETEGLFRFVRLVKWVALGVITLAAGVIVVGYLFFVRAVNKQESWTDAERELRGGMLQYGEPIVKLAHVYVRRPTNYFRGANGVLAVTPRRVLYVGLEPRDKLASADAPPAILTSEFPNDSTLSITRHRVYLMTARGVTVSDHDRSETFAAARGYEAELDSLAASVQRYHDAARHAADAERALRAQVDSILRAPLFYVVRRGDALSTIAARFGATPDEIRTWNHLSGDRVKIGQRLTVKPEGIRAPSRLPVQAATTPAMTAPSPPISPAIPPATTAAPDGGASRAPTPAGATHSTSSVPAATSHRTP